MSENVTLTKSQVELLRLVADEQILFTLGMSRIKGMNKTDVYERLDTRTKVTAAMKKLRAAGLVSPALGASRGMSKVVALTGKGIEALADLD